MKIFKIIAAFLILLGIYYFLSPTLPAVVSVKNLAPIRSFSENLTLDVTITNYTLQEKQIYLDSSDTDTSISLYVDYGPVAAKPPLSKYQAESVLTLPPLGHVTRTINLALIESGSQPKHQIVNGSSGSLALGQGRHTYTVSWGNYLSGEQVFGVE